VRNGGQRLTLVGDPAQNVAQAAVEAAAAAPLDRPGPPNSMDGNEFQDGDDAALRRTPYTRIVLSY